jgi:hypothetical protein
METNTPQMISLIFFVFAVMDSFFYLFVLFQLDQNKFLFFYVIMLNP